MLESISINYYIVTFLTFVMFIIAFYILFLALKWMKAENRLIKMTYTLSKDLKESTIEDYMSQLDSIDIPPRESYWNAIKAAYALVELDKDIDDSVKKKFRIAILAKGVLVE